ncbi:hypothetical protein B0H63DRAFT_145280 [Podospora didyma]|uniref:Uncharacterized protein n=1 Tax=Podospora didyma TaxID=330526 RepID=A0AAE0NSN6_9PEZI|nr:hypothetical protein B0H63DRAFT_145280 [Podospora didyma]
MRTRSESTASASALASSSRTVSSAATRWALRPRQAADARGSHSAGETSPRAAPRIGGRVTRSSLATAVPIAASTNSNVQTSAPPQPPRPPSHPPHTPLPTRISTRSHKRAALPPPADSQDSHAPANRASKRRRHQSGFYGEDSDNDDDGDDDDDDDLDNAYPSPSDDELGHDQYQQQSPAHAPPSHTPRGTRPPLCTPPSKAKRTGAPTPAAGSANKKRRPVQLAVGNPRPALDQETPAYISNPVIPNWTALPYYVWVQIFEYAFASLEDREGVDWLLATSLACRTFTEPALTALYQCPPLLTRPMAHGLASLLAMDPSQTLYNYRAKVEKLRINVAEIAAKTYLGSFLDFKSLVTHLPRLKVIDFFHDKDRPPYRELDDNLRWHYPDSLFEALNPAENAHLDYVPPRLQGWRWNRRMMGDLDMSRIESLHISSPSFVHLKKLAFVNYQVPSLNAPGDPETDEKKAMDQAYRESLAKPISVLPNLEYLSIECSTAVNGHFLKLLPKTLRTLELINCWEVTGEDFATYLESHPDRCKLQHLNLRHNQSLDLSFLTILGTACPDLETLRGDLKYYKHHEFYQDSEPNYENVLTADQVPNWPQNLEVIELRNMRKWDTDAVETFFRSLVDSAPRLLKLRELDIKAMLDIPFRQRSALRDKWEAKLKDMFLRKKTDPLPFFSLRSLLGSSEAVNAVAPRTAPKSHTEAASRRSTRVLTRVLSNASSRASSVGREMRNGRARPSYAEADTDDEDDGEEGMTDPEEESPPAGQRENESSPVADSFCHGMCHKVDIQLDNQKPTEEVWRMEDFRDGDDSDDPSDEDWVAR